jgi:hypothetical protein
MLDLNDIINNLANKKVTPSWFNTRDWASVAPALRNRSFFSATISSAKVLTKMRNMLLDWQAGAVEDTAGGVAYKETGLAKFRETAAEFMIQEGLATEDDYADQRIQNVVSNARLQLIYNTNLEQAATFAAWQVQMRDPYELNRRPAARFFRRSGAVTKRPRHVEAEGVVRRWDDFAFWMFQNAADIGGFGVPWGPFGFNSYMVQEPVGRAEAERLGLVQKGEVVPVPDLTQFGVSLGSQFNHGVDATLDDVTPEIRAKAQKAIVARLGAGAIGPDGKPTLDALRQARAAIGRPVPPTPVPVVKTRKPRVAKVKPPVVPDPVVPVRTFDSIKKNLEDEIEKSKAVVDEYEAAEAERERLHREWLVAYSNYNDPLANALKDKKNAATTRKRQVLDQYMGTIERFRELVSVPVSERGKISISYETQKAEELLRGSTRVSDGVLIAERYTAKSLLRDIVVGTTKESRAYADPELFRIRINPNITDASVVAHEITHVTEVKGGVLQQAFDFLQLRSKGEKPISLKRLTGVSQYKKWEVAYKDKWEELGGRVYSGKVYPDATEILTMGIERLHRNPAQFYKTDPQYFEFVVRTLQQL